MKFCHTPVVKKLPASHGIPKVYFPVIPRIYISKSRCNTTLRHNRMGLSQERLTHQSRAESPHGTFYSSSNTGTTGTNDNDIMFNDLYI
jgi:hypothetical protein